jgi:hypothetical protein
MVTEIELFESANTKSIVNGNKKKGNYFLLSLFLFLFKV